MTTPFSSFCAVLFQYCTVMLLAFMGSVDAAECTPRQLRAELITVLDTRLADAEFRHRVAMLASRYIATDEATQQSLVKQLSPLRAQMRGLRSKFLNESRDSMSNSAYGREQLHADLIRQRDVVIQAAISIVKAHGLPVPTGIDFDGFSDKRRNTL